MVIHMTARALMPCAPAPKGKHLAPRRSAPSRVPHEPMYRLKTEAMKTTSPGRMPMAHMTRAWLLAIACQSPRPMANMVGRPVVPEVPWMWWTSDWGMHR